MIIKGLKPEISDLMVSSFPINVTDFGYKLNSKIAFVNDLLLGRIGKEEIVRKLVLHPESQIHTGVTAATRATKNHKKNFCNSTASSLPDCKLKSVFVGIIENQEDASLKPNVYIIPISTFDSLKFKSKDQLDSDEILNDLLSYLQNKNSSIAKSELHCIENILALFSPQTPGSKLKAHQVINPDIIKYLQKTSQKKINSNKINHLHTNRSESCGCAKTVLFESDNNLCEFKSIQDIKPGIVKQLREKFLGNNSVEEAKVSLLNTKNVCDDNALTKPNFESRVLGKKNLLKSAKVDVGVEANLTSCSCIKNTCCQNRYCGNLINVNCCPAKHNMSNLPNHETRNYCDRSSRTKKDFKNYSLLLPSAGKTIECCCSGSESEYEEPDYIKTNYTCSHRTSPCQFHNLSCGHSQYLKACNCSSSNDVEFSNDNCEACAMPSNRSCEPSEESMSSNSSRKFSEESMPSDCSCKSSEESMPSDCSCESSEESSCDLSSRRRAIYDCQYCPFSDSSGTTRCCSKCLSTKNVGQISDSSSLKTNSKAKSSYQTSHSNRTDKASSVNSRNAIDEVVEKKSIKPMHSSKSIVSEEESLIKFDEIRQVERRIRRMNSIVPGIKILKSLDTNDTGSDSLDRNPRLLEYRNRIRSALNKQKKIPANPLARISVQNKKVFEKNALVATEIGRYGSINVSNIMDGDVEDGAGVSEKNTVKDLPAGNDVEDDFEPKDPEYRYRAPIPSSSRQKSDFFVSQSFHCKRNRSRVPVTRKNMKTSQTEEDIMSSNSLKFLPLTRSKTNNSISSEIHSDSTGESLFRYRKQKAKIFSSKNTVKRLISKFNSQNVNQTSPDSSSLESFEEASSSNTKVSLKISHLPSSAAIECARKCPVPMLRREWKVDDILPRQLSRDELDYDMLLTDDDIDE